MSKTQKVAVLRRARKLIDDRTESYICIALTEPLRYGAPDSLRCASRALRKLVEKRLKGCYTLEEWLEDVKGVNVQDDHHSEDRLRVTRLAWIDSLIEEFS